MKFVECSKCLLNSNYYPIKVDNSGICNYCVQIDQLKKEYGTGNSSGKAKLQKIIDEIKLLGKEKKYNCILGVSGGTDSSFLLYKAVKEWGLKPLAVHYDNTWNTSTASSNIYKLCKLLNVDLYTYVINNKEADDIYLSFLKSGVPELEASTDLAYAYILRKVARENKIKFVLEAHTFVNEGITPINVNYFDGRYIKNIHDSYGSVKMQTYPLLTLSKFLYSVFFDRIKFVRPLWYINYQKHNAIDFLTKKCDWKYYGGHHLENNMTSFYHSVFLPERYKINLKINTVASMVREGWCSREEGIDKMNNDQNNFKIKKYVLKRLNLSSEKYLELISQKKKNWKNFKTYKNFFELFNFFFFIALKLDLIPKSFYIKYCKKND